MNDVANVLAEMSVLDGQLEGLWMTLSLLKSTTTEGIDNEWQVRGTIAALEDMAEIYYNKYNSVHEAIKDLLKETLSTAKEDQADKMQLTALKLGCDALMEKDPVAYKEYVEQIINNTQNFKSYYAATCKELIDQINKMLANGKIEN